MKIGEYEQMMAYLTRPRFKDGTIPKQKPFTKEEFEKRADGLVQGSFGGMRRNIEGVKLLKDTMDELISKALDSGAIKSRKEAVDFILEREKYYSNIIESEKSNGEIFHIGTEDEITIEQLIKAAGDFLNFDGSYQEAPTYPGSTKRRCPDITKAKKILGYSPRFKWQESLEETLEWYKDFFEKGETAFETSFEEPDSV